MAYSTLQQQLVDSGSHSTAAEAHGILCGLLCGEVKPQAALTKWHTALEISDHLDDLDTWPDVVAATLQDEAMRFSPLLPEDDEPLENRLIAIGSWCSGLLYGFGVSESDADASDEVQEYLRDLAEFSRIDETLAEDAEDGNEMEAAYFEVVEYLKVGMMLLYDNCHEKVLVSKTLSKLPKE